MNTNDDKANYKMVRNQCKVQIENKNNNKQYIRNKIGKVSKTKKCGQLINNFKTENW